MYDFIESLNLLQEGKNLIFASRADAERFAKSAKVELEYYDYDFIDEEHFKAKGYNGNIYWLH